MTALILVVLGVVVLVVAFAAHPLPNGDIISFLGLPIGMLLIVIAVIEHFNLTSGAS